MEKDTLESIVSFLKQDELKNMNMLYFMENNPIHSLERIGDSVLLRGKSDQRWVYISTPDEQQLNKVLRLLNEDDKYFAVVEDWMLPLLTEGKTILWQMSTMKLVLPDHVKLGETDDSRIAPLSIDDAQYVYDNSLYQGAITPDYVRNRIKNGPSAGIRESGKLVGWAMTHDDLALGLLHVLDDYRRRGYASALTAFLIRLMRNQGKIPFAHIEENNFKSMALAMKSGFRQDRRVHWLKIQ
jgi:8-oxo-dGTP diphosphatase